MNARAHEHRKCQKRKTQQLHLAHYMRHGIWFVVYLIRQKRIKRLWINPNKNTQKGRYTHRQLHMNWRFFGAQTAVMAEEGEVRDFDA